MHSIVSTKYFLSTVMDFKQFLLNSLLIDRSSLRRLTESIILLSDIREAKVGAGQVAERSKA
jgi:hypothetical protein